MERHINRIRERAILQQSEVIIMVERNLGFEAEHHHRALSGIPYTRHRIDHQAKRYGILTTEDIKLAMMTLFNNMLRDQRVILQQWTIQYNTAFEGATSIYSVPVQTMLMLFKRPRCLNGKVGGMKDDICIAVQLVVYYSVRPVSDSDILNLI